MKGFTPDAPPEDRNRRRRKHRKHHPVSKEALFALRTRLLLYPIKASSHTKEALFENRLYLHRNKSEKQPENKEKTNVIMRKCCIKQGKTHGKPQKMKKYRKKKPENLAEPQKSHTFATAYEKQGRLAQLV